MSMTGEGYKQSPRAKAAVDRALKMMSEGKSDKAPTREETQARQAAGRKAQESIDRITAKRDAANLPSLQKRRADMESTYSKGKDWQYADREQNLSDDERQSRGMRGNMDQLAQKIENVKKYGYKQGGKVIKMAYGGSDVNANANAAYARDMAAAAKRYQQQAAAQKMSQATQTKTYTPPASKSSYTTPVSSSYVSRTSAPAGFSSFTPTPKPVVVAPKPVAKVVAPPAPVARAPIAAPAPKAPPPRAPSGPTASEKAAAAAAIKQAADRDAAAAKQAAAQKVAQAQQEAAAKALADEAKARAERAKTPPVVPNAPTSYNLGAVNKPRSAYKEGGKVSTHIRSKSSPNW